MYVCSTVDIIHQIQFWYLELFQFCIFTTAELNYNPVLNFDGKKLF